MINLNEKHYKAIEMLCQPDSNISQIAKELGVSRNTIYNWMADDKFKAELGKTEQEIKNRIQSIYVKRLPVVIERLYELTKSKDNRTALAASKEWMDRGLGKVTTPVEVDDKRDSENDFDIQAALEKIEDNTTPIPLKYGKSS